MSAAGKVVLAPWGINLASWVMFLKVKIIQGGTLKSALREKKIRLTSVKFCATLQTLGN